MVTKRTNKKDHRVAKRARSSSGKGALRGGLPFDVRIPNAVTRAAMAELEAGGGKVHRGSAAQVIDDILAGGNDE